MASDWARQRLFQRLVREEWLKADAVGAAVFAPADRCGSQINYVDASLNEALTIDTRRIDRVVSEYATVTPQGIAVDGMANLAAPNLVQFKPVTMAAGDCDWIPAKRPAWFAFQRT